MEFRYGPYEAEHHKRNQTRLKGTRGIIVLFLWEPLPPPRSIAEFYTEDEP